MAFPTVGLDYPVVIVRLAVSGHAVVVVWRCSPCRLFGGQTRRTLRHAYSDAFGD